MKTGDGNVVRYVKCRYYEEIGRESGQRIAQSSPLIPSNHIRSPHSDEEGWSQDWIAITGSKLTCGVVGSWDSGVVGYRGFLG